MSSRTRHFPTRRIALLGLIAMSGCGFAPVYGPGGAANALRGSVAYDVPETVAGFRLRERLVERLGPTAQERFVLKVKLGAKQSAATITSDGDTTRFNVAGTADWVLEDTSTDDIAAHGQVKTFTSYSATGSTVATQAARTDANARLSEALADLIVSRLLLIGGDIAG